MSPHESIYQPELATIKKVASLTNNEKLFDISLNHGKPLGHKPGQFVEVSVFGVGEAPISVTSAPLDGNGTFQLGIRNVGNVTNAMHGLQAGAIIGIRGPFGTAFPTEEAKGKDVLVVAGGIGLIPVRSFIRHILAHRKDYGKLTILFGARSPSERLFTNELEEWKNNKEMEYLETVDRGDASWKGNVGVITTLFKKIEPDPKKTITAIVGPPIMYRFVIIECKNKELLDSQMYLSLERNMKCGVGKCGHCQINSTYVCQDGPVFTYADIVKKNLKEAI